MITYEGVVSIARSVGVTEQDVREGQAAGLSLEAITAYLRALGVGPSRRSRPPVYVDWQLLAKNWNRAGARGRGQRFTTQPRSGTTPAHGVQRPPRRAPPAPPIKKIEIRGPRVLETPRKLLVVIPEGKFYRVYYLPRDVKSRNPSVLSSPLALRKALRSWPSHLARVVGLKGKLLAETRLSSGGSEAKSLGPLVNDWTLALPGPVRFRPRARAKIPANAARLTWEVLPPGWWRLQSSWSRKAGLGHALGRAGAVHRIEFISSFSPQKWYAGSHLGARLYYVAEFEGIAIAECAEFGNALYYVRGPNWRDVFRLTKRAALQAGARRLIHRGNWRARLTALISVPHE